MSAIDKWMDRVYGETDFGRSVATSVAGLVGLTTYLLLGDWIVSAFVSIIVFPLVRLLSTWLYESRRRVMQMQLERKEAVGTYERLSDEEQEVVEAFVHAGGSVMTWSQVNSLSLPSSAVESLMQRQFLTTSMTADLVRETFVLDSAIFDAAVSKRRHSATLKQSIEPSQPRA